jgi:hypothetical protein
MTFVMENLTSFTLVADCFKCRYEYKGRMKLEIKKWRFLFFFFLGGGGGGGGEFC